MGQTSVQRIVVTNQGNFSDGNGSITIYDPASGVTVPDAGLDIPSIFQSATIVGNRIYVMSNTAEQIDILDLETGDRVGQIPSVTSPRYMLVKGSKAYVTNLYKENFAGGSVTVIDLTSDMVMSTIDVADNPEGMALIGNKLYVASPAFGFGTALTVIDTTTDQAIEQVSVDCDGPRTLAALPNKHLLVFCTGQTVWNADYSAIVSTTDGKVLEFEPESGEQTEWFAKPTTDQSFGPGQDDYFAPETGEAYSLWGNAVLRASGRGSTVDTLDLGGDDRIGAMAYDAKAKLLYVGRAPADNPFTATGYVAAYDRDGNEVSRFNAGIAPMHIDFKRAEATSAELNPELPTKTTIHDVYPNPTNGLVSFVLDSDESEYVHIDIWSNTGARVSTAFSGLISAGRHTIRWNGSRFASGTYFVRISSEGRTKAIRPISVLR